MDYTLEIDQKNQTLLIRATCELNQEIRKSILQDIARQLKKNDFSRALIDLRETTFDYHTPMTGAAELTAYMKVLNIPAQTKLAFLYTEAGPHRKHYEQVSQQAGYNVRYFKTLNDALTWLK